MHFVSVSQFSIIVLVLGIIGSPKGSLCPKPNRSSKSLTRWPRRFYTRSFISENLISHGFCGNKEQGGRRRPGRWQSLGKGFALALSRATTQIFCFSCCRVLECDGDSESLRRFVWVIARAVTLTLFCSRCFITKPPFNDI